MTFAFTAALAAAALGVAVSVRPTLAAAATLTTCAATALARRPIPRAWFPVAAIITVVAGRMAGYVIGPPGLKDVALVVGAGLLAASGRPTRRNLRSSAGIAAAFVVPTLLAISTGAVDMASASPGLVLGLLAGTAFYAGISLSSDGRRTVLTGLFVVTVIGGVVGIVEFISQHHVLPGAGSGAFRGPFQARSFYGHALLFSTVSTTAGLVGIARMAGQQLRGRALMLTAAGTAVLLAAAATSLSRSVFAILGAGLVWLLVPSSGNSRVRSVGVAAVLVIGVGIAGATTPNVREGYIERFRQHIEVGQPVRGQAWQVAVEETTLTSVVVGHGPQYVRREAQAGRYLLPSEFATLDNQWAALLVDYGAPTMGFVLVLTALAAVRLRRTDVAVSMAVVGVGTAGMVFEILGWGETGILLFFAVGAAARPQLVTS